MTARSGVVACAALAVLVVAAGPADAGRRRRQCQVGCRESIARCVETGIRPGACRRLWMRWCMRSGPSVCEPRETTTTSSTLPRASTTTMPPILGSTSTTSSTSPFPTVTTTSTTTTSSTTTSTSSTTTTSHVPPEHLWTTTGPIQWSTLPPDTAGRGDRFPLALTADVAAMRVEGTVHACRSSVAPEDCAGDSYVAIEPATFAGPPGTFDFTGVVTTVGYPCVVGEEMYAVAQVTLVAADGSRQGPVPTPLARFRLGADTSSVIDATPAELTLFVTPGAPPPIGTIYASVYCGSGALVATPDVDWLTISPRINPQGVELTPTTSLDPAGSPYHANVTLEATDPPGPPIVIPVTVHVAPLVMRWVTPPPDEAKPVDGFPLALEVSGPVDRVRVRLRSLRPHPYYRWVETSLLAYEPATQESPPGVLTFAASRPGDCVDALDLDVAPEVWILGDDDTELGPFPFPPAPIHLQSGTLAQGLGLSLDAGALHFRTVRGGVLEPGGVTLWLECVDGSPTEAEWTASTDVPWLTLSETTGRLYARSGIYSPTFEVNVLPLTLDPSGGPYAGHVTIVAPGVRDEPLVLPVVLEFADDIQVEWPQPPPSVIDVAQEFDLSLAVSGAVQQVDGRVMPCNFAPPYCSYDLGGSFSIGLTAGGYFSGPPGEFPLHGRRWATCFTDTGQSYFGARFTVTRGDGTREGPFYAPRLPFTEPAATTYSVFPPAITLRGLAGQDVLAATISPTWLCGAPRGWTAATNVPWLLLSRLSGAIGFRVRDDVTVVADTSLLDPGGSPYEGHVVLGETGRVEPVAVVPVRVEIFGAE